MWQNMQTVHEMWCFECLIALSFDALVFYNIIKSGRLVSIDSSVFVMTWIEFLTSFPMALKNPINDMTVMDTNMPTHKVISWLCGKLIFSMIFQDFFF